MKDKKDELKEELQKIKDELDELNTFLENWKKVVKETEKNNKKEK